MLALIPKLRKNITSALLFATTITFVSCATQKDPPRLVSAPDDHLLHAKWGVERYTIASRLDPETGWNHCVFWDHDQAIADEVIVCVVVRRFSFRSDYDSVGNACVLVDDGTVDHANETQSHWR